MDIDAAGRRWVLGRLERREITPKTAKQHRAVIHDLARCCGDPHPSKITRRDVSRWLAGMDVVPGVVRYRLQVIRSLYRHLNEAGATSRDPTKGLVAPRMPRSLPRACTAEQVARILAACPHSRARAIVLCEVQCGLRACEVSRLEMGDLDPVRRTMRVVGKWRKERVLPVPDEAWEAIERYLGDCPARSGPLFRSRIPGREHAGLSAEWISTLISRLMHAAGVNESGHSLRHTAATDVLDRTDNVLVVKEMLGHESLQTTQIYTKLKTAKLKEAMDGRRYAGAQCSQNEEAG